MESLCFPVRNFEQFGEDGIGEDEVAEDNLPPPMNDDEVKVEALDISNVIVEDVDHGEEAPVVEKRIKMMINVLITKVVFLSSIMIHHVIKSTI
jgi:hypothetical protein